MPERPLLAAATLVTIVAIAFQVRPDLAWTIVITFVVSALIEQMRTYKKS